MSLGCLTPQKQQVMNELGQNRECYNHVLDLYGLLSVSTDVKDGVLRHLLRSIDGSRAPLYRLAQVNDDWAQLIAQSSYRSHWVTLDGVNADGADEWEEAQRVAAYMPKVSNLSISIVLPLPSQQIIQWERIAAMFPHIRRVSMVLFGQTSETTLPNFLRGLKPFEKCVKVSLCNYTNVTSPEAMRCLLGLFPNATHISLNSQFHLKYLQSPQLVRSLQWVYNDDEFLEEVTNEHILARMSSLEELCLEWDGAERRIQINPSLITSNWSHLRRVAFEGDGKTGGATRLATALLRSCRDLSEFMFVSDTFEPDMGQLPAMLLHMDTLGLSCQVSDYLLLVFLEKTPLLRRLLIKAEVEMISSMDLFRRVVHSRPIPLTHLSVLIPHHGHNYYEDLINFTDWLVMIVQFFHSHLRELKIEFMKSIWNPMITRHQLDEAGERNLSSELVLRDTETRIHTTNYHQARVLNRLFSSFPSLTRMSSLTITFLDRLMDWDLLVQCVTRCSSLNSLKIKIHNSFTFTLAHITELLGASSLAISQEGHNLKQLYIGFLSCTARDDYLARLRNHYTPAILHNLCNQLPVRVKPSDTSLAADDLNYSYLLISIN